MPEDSWNVEDRPEGNDFEHVTNDPSARHIYDRLALEGSRFRS